LGCTTPPDWAAQPPLIPDQQKQTISDTYASLNLFEVSNPRRGDETESAPRPLRPWGARGPASPESEGLPPSFDGPIRARRGRREVNPLRRHKAPAGGLWETGRWGGSRTDVQALKRPGRGHSEVASKNAAVRPARPRRGAKVSRPRRRAAPARWPGCRRAWHPCRQGAGTCRLASPSSPRHPACTALRTPRPRTRARVRLRKIRPGPPPPALAGRGPSCPDPRARALDEKPPNAPPPGRRSRAAAAEALRARGYEKIPVFRPAAGECGPSEPHPLLSRPAVSSQPGWAPLAGASRARAIA
jgi:hypothetical protein